MTNFLKETLEVLKRSGKTPDDVRWVGKREPDYLAAIKARVEVLPCGTWAEFERFADFDYDDGYGGVEVASDLKVVGDDWWLERGEYDGSEWWEFKTLPARPKEPTPLRPDDLKREVLTTS